MNHRARPGFAIHEIVAAAAALGIALAVAWVAGDAARRASASTESLNNLRTISGAYS